MVYDFYSTGFDDQLTLNDNIQSFRRIRVRPKVLVDIWANFTSRCSTILLNPIEIPYPVLTAPTSFHRLADREHGELATVRAAVALSLEFFSTLVSIICF